MAASAVSPDGGPAGQAALKFHHEPDSKPRVDGSSSPSASDGSQGKHDGRDTNQNRNGSNKFRCRVAMACVHCRHRKIRCDGAQPSCYTCTRLQRKCEYERVSEHDNLLSRERKRLSRERKAARMAANTPAHSNPTSDANKDEKTAGMGAQQVHLPFEHKAQSPTLTIPMTQMAAVTQATPTDIPTSMIQTTPAPDATIPPAWASTQGNPTKDMAPWIMPPAFATPDAALNNMATQQESLLSLRSSADPSLLELSAPSSSLGTDSPSLMSMWVDGQKSAAAKDTNPAVPQLSDFGQSITGLPGTSLESESTVVDPLELTTSMDTPLKLFSDTQLPSTMANTPSSVDTNTVSDTGSSVLGPNVSMTMSPLSPQLAPTTFDGLDTNMEQRPLGGLDEPEVAPGTYSASVPTTEAPLAFGTDLEPSSLPALSSWTQLAPSNA